MKGVTTFDFSKQINENSFKIIKNIKTEKLIQEISEMKAKVTKKKIISMTENRKHPIPMIVSIYLRNAGRNILSIPIIKSLL